MSAYQLNLRYLHYFLVVAEELNFTRAAARLNMAQPPLSVQIKKLEGEIGADLFRRDNRNVELTEAGRILLAEAKQMLAMSERAIDMTRRAAKGEFGHLSIAYTNPAGYLVFPRILNLFKALRPGVALDFHDLRIPQQLAQLQRRELDLGFVWLPVAASELDVRVVANDPYVVALPAHHPLAALDEVSIKQLSGEPLVSVPRAFDPEVRREMEQLFRASRARLNVAYELELCCRSSASCRWVAGADMLPGYVRQVPREGVTFRPLRPESPARQLAIVVHKGATGLARDFFDFTVKQCAQARGGRQEQSGTNGRNRRLTDGSG